jgi:RsiW-degrading membrane proteinase PrsW (M82 family)
LSDLLSSSQLWVRAAAAFLPVLVFLSLLVFFDSFRLVRHRRLGYALLAGAACGVVTFLVNSVIMSLLRWEIFTFAIFVAPVVEEILKGLYLWWLVRTGRAGFMIDAAILGFATGAGFAMAENLYYLDALPDAPFIVWLIRGFGTAIMHGGATAIFAILMRSISDERRPGSPAVWLPGLVLAIVFHSAFNRFMIWPVPTTVVLLVVLPASLIGVYRVGQRRLRRWLGTGFDHDTELLAMIRDGEVSGTPLGRYLMSLRDSFRPETVADMLCLLRLQAELSIRAKGMLVLKEHGLKPVPDPEINEKLDEIRWLEGAVGRTGLLAMRPICRWRDANRWQRHLLESEKTD